MGALGYWYDDESRLYDLRARFYDARLARFMQEDTYRGSPQDPLSLNLYMYCFNNPLVYYDPTGHAPKGRPTTVYLPGGGTTTGYIKNGITTLADGSRPKEGSVVKTANGYYEMKNGSGVKVDGPPKASTGSGNHSSGGSSSNEVTSITATSSRSGTVYQETTTYNKDGSKTITSTVTQGDKKESSTINKKPDGTIVQIGTDLEIGSGGFGDGSSGGGRDGKGGFGGGSSGGSRVTQTDKDVVYHAILNTLKDLGYLATETLKLYAKQLVTQFLFHKLAVLAINTALSNEVATMVIELANGLKSAAMRLKKIGYGFISEIFDASDGSLSHMSSEEFDLFDDLLAAGKVANHLDDFLYDPSILGRFTPEGLYDHLSNLGHDVLPLSNGSLSGVSFIDGGGYKVNWGGGQDTSISPCRKKSPWRRCVL